MFARSQLLHRGARRLSLSQRLPSRKLILIALDWTRPKDPPMSLGHASILANLRAKRVHVVEKSWAVNKTDFSPQRVSEFVLSHNSKNPATDLALGAYVWNENAIQQIISQVRQHGFKGRIILGGPQISYVKKGIEAFYPLVDVFVRGYAEDAVAQLMISKEDQPIIPGVHYANEPDLGLSAKVNLSDIPSPFLDGIIPPQSFIRWETQRGCPFRCSFCQHRESDSSQQRRYFEESRIMREIEWLTRHPVINDIAVLDPTFNSGPNYLNVLQEFLNRDYAGKLSLQARMEMVTPDFLNIVEQLNVKGRTVLEFGLQTIHKHEQALIERPNNMKKVVDVLKETKRRNIPIEISLIFGLPGQTLESFKSSVDFCKQHEAGAIYAFPLMLLRGTPLHAKKNQLGLIESSDINIPTIPRQQEGIPHVVASNTFSFDEWQKMAEIAESLERYNQTQASKANNVNKKRDNMRLSWWSKANNPVSGSHLKTDGSDNSSLMKHGVKS